jgi:hypothetical protein
MLEEHIALLKARLARTINPAEIRHLERLIKNLQRLADAPMRETK